MKRRIRTQKSTLQINEQNLGKVAESEIVAKQGNLTLENRRVANPGTLRILKSCRSIPFEGFNFTFDNDSKSET